MMRDMTVHNTSALSDQEALQWLMVQPARFETSVSELARRWGWNRMRTLRRLRQWTAEEKIRRDMTHGGRSIITINSGVTMIKADQVNIFSATNDYNGNDNDHLPNLGWNLPNLGMPQALAAVMAGLAVAVAWYGVQINAWYGGSLGRTAEAASLLSGLSMVGDLVAFFLPATAGYLWAAQRRLEAIAGWGLWVGTMSIAIMAALGFASVNIADTTAARDKNASAVSELRQRIERLTSQRAAIAETRPVAAIEAELQLAQPAAATVWSRTNGCSDVTQARSGELCGSIIRLRQMIASAQRRDQIDAELDQARTALAALPAITSADPQAEMAAELTSLSPATAALLRILGMTLLPQISGLVLMLATGLWRMRRAAR